MKQHGFARISVWRDENIENELKELLISNEETKKIYPYDFNFSLSGKFEKDNSFTLLCNIENKEEIASLPVSMGFHPYFKVPDTLKNNIKFDFAGGEDAENNGEVWKNGGTLYLDNPKLKNPEAIIKIDIPELGTLIIDASIEYQKIWVWSQPGKDFICIEPTMRDLDGLLNNPKIIRPGETFSASINFKLQNC